MRAITEGEVEAAFDEPMKRLRQEPTVADLDNVYNEITSRLGKLFDEADLVGVDDLGLQAVIHRVIENKKYAETMVEKLRDATGNNPQEQEEIRKGLKLVGVGHVNIQTALIALGKRMNESEFNEKVKDPLKAINQLKKQSEPVDPKNKSDPGASTKKKGGGSKTTLWIVLAVVGVVVVGATAFFLLRKK